MSLKTVKYSPMTQRKKTCALRTKTGGFWFPLCRPFEGRTGLDQRLTKILNFTVFKPGEVESSQKRRGDPSGCPATIKTTQYCGVCPSKLVV